MPKQKSPVSKAARENKELQYELNSQSSRYKKGDYASLSDGMVP
ncbi:hypothetical protein JCM39194_17300 [Desulfotomaculum varum]